jgi:glycosyltransferase involved in cell wall biosynthesis
MKEGGLRIKGVTKESSPGFPLISIVMVTWNAEKHFRQALESVVSQDYPNKEIIVVDGGSSDGTLSIIDDFSASVDYWISEPDEGIYHAMNKGILLASGDWIGFKNADDWYLPGAFRLLAENINASPYVGLWYGNSYSVLQEEPLKLSPFFTDHATLGSNPGIDHRCSFVKANAHRKTLFDLRYRLAADLDVFWRLKKSGVVFQHTGAFMAYKRFGGASDGTRILSESFRINREHAGLVFALRSVLESRFRFWIWKSGNVVLRFLLGEKGFHRFKSRKIKPHNQPDLSSH